MNSADWQIRDRFLELRCPWLTLIGEHLQEPQQGQILEYWRVEKADSVIILPIQNHQIILPPPTYCPGLGKSTMDFPGGRLPEGQQPGTIVATILQRELGVAVEEITEILPLNSQGWAVNSSFSNQKLYGFVADLLSTAQIPVNFVGSTYATTDRGIRSLLKSLTCLQCRSVLLEWWVTRLRS